MSVRLSVCLWQIKPVTHHFHHLGGGCSSLLELLSYHPNTCIRTDKHLKDMELCRKTEQTFFSIVEMCQFSFRFIPMSFFPTMGFLLWIFSLDSYLGSWHCYAFQFCMYLLSFAHIFLTCKKKTQFNPPPPVNGE